ncbi:restriction endonuclease subunit S [Escherichia albertii]|uniref:restriction endonuclease subunit S n=1 Tax=Escherichia albertii TaxID=208962 RepID=UPI0006A0EDA7|nr:restriction endonuclease subunit S [Escherichia albertii]CTU55580.1 restriction modification system DNA specificity domain-containing protein [Escherichia coli]EFF0795623.1 restriction endonuclease subunit S [Escherichia albertii]EHG7528317.1 restriction endonuclease subunit S [Escherichia albertii]EJM0809999.1 restriction endonuclease subunit S [Escherichia albertii]EJM1768611.1 restriction endonuclease subunit S [Escherichia albertii]
MGSKWEKIKLKEVVDIITTKVDVSQISLCDYISTENMLTNFGGISIANSKPSTGKITKFHSGDILFSNIRTYFKKLWLADRTGGCSNDVIVFRPKKNINSNYILSVLMDQKFIEHTVLTSKGTKMPRGDKTAILDYEFNLAPDKYCQHIAKTNTLIFSKLKSNEVINKSLEQMSQTLFKSWFVDFDPVIDNALDAGNPIPEALQTRAKLRQKVRNSADFKPLPTEIRSLFPSEFEETELGWVPKDWLPQSMHELVESVSITYPLKKSDKVVFLNTGDIEKGVFLHNSYSCTKGLPGQAKKSIKKGDILFSEIRPENKRYAFVYFESEDYVVSTKLMVLRAKNGVNPLLPYFILTLENNIKKLQRIAELRSGTFPQITFRELEFITFTMPNNHLIMDLFIKNCLSPNYNKMVGIREMNKNLTALRDTLLPKLISGDLSLEDLPDLSTDTEAA